MKPLGGNWGTLNRATVKGLDPHGVLVEVPALAPGGTIGPIPTAVADLAIGEAVIVANISTSRDSLVVLGRVPGRAATVGEIPTLSATIAALQAADASQVSSINTNSAAITALQARATTDEGLIASHTHTTAPSGFAVTGNETVSGSLGVTGALTAASVGTGAGAITTTGAVNAGTVVASGAASAASVTASGSLSAEAAKFTTATVTADHIRTAARFDPPAGALGGPAARDVRQPVTHAGSGTMSVVPTTEATLFTLAFTPRSDCHPRVFFHLSGFCSVAAGAVAGTTGQINIRTQIIRQSDSFTPADTGFNRNMFAIVATNDKRARSEPDFTMTPDCALTAGTLYRLQVSAVSDANLGAAVTVDNWAASVMEIARAV